MNKRSEFLSFLKQSRSPINESIINQVAKGFRVCFEAEQDSEPVYLTGEKTNNGYHVDITYNGNQNGFDSIPLIKQYIQSSTEINSLFNEANDHDIISRDINDYSLYGWILFDIDIKSVSAEHDADMNGPAEGAELDFDVNISDMEFTLSDDTNDYEITMDNDSIESLNIKDDVIDRIVKWINEEEYEAIMKNIIAEHEENRVGI